MHDASAHASDASLPMKKITQLGDFFKHSVQDFINAINKKGFISVQVGQVIFLLRQAKQKKSSCPLSFFGCLKHASQKGLVYVRADLFVPEHRLLCTRAFHTDNVGGCAEDYIGRPSSM